MEYKFRLWLMQNNKKVFGEGPLELLKRVDELGSLRQAAISMDMSYSKAWGIIKRIEEELQIPILERQVGGKKGGGSVLTKEARCFMDRYMAFKNRLESIIEREYKKFFKD